MGDDLLLTNKFISEEISKENNDSKNFNKYINARNNYNNIYTENHINELTKKNELLEENTILSESLSDNIYGKQNSIKYDNKQFKRTKISIDSRNRQKITKINSEIIKTAYKKHNWTFKSEYQSIRIKVYAPNHGFTENDIGNTEIFFTGLSATDVYDKIGIKREYIEYDNDKNSPRFSIKLIYFPKPSNNEPKDLYYNSITNTYESDYFEIELSDLINVKFIKNSTFGGNSVKINKIISYEQGYDNPSHYKIDLGKRFSNVYMVRLISIEIPNTTYTINSISKVSEIGSLKLKTKINSKIKWITDNNYFNTYNLSLYSDKIFLNTINLNKYSSCYNNSNLNMKQLNYSNNILSKIAQDTILLDNFNMITDNNNLDLDFYSPKLFHVSNCPSANSIQFDTFVNNNAKYWLPNIYHNFGKTLIYDLNNSIQSTNDNIYNSQIYNTKFKNSNLFYYNYYNKIVSTNEYNKIDFDNSSTYKSIFLEYDDELNSYKDNLRIPKYQGYFLFENNLLNKNENDTILSNEYVETQDIDYSEYIFPITTTNSEKFMAPVIVPNDIEKQSNIKLINQKRYPIYELSLNDGKYTKNEFINVLQNSLSNVKTQIITGYEKFFKKKNIDIKKNYDYDNQDNINFKVNINKNLNLIDIRQYSKIQSFEYSKTYNSNIIYYNEGIPYINLKLYGHQLKTGDKIYIENARGFENISSEKINGEHEVYVMPSFKIYLRLIFPLPDLTYLDQNEYFDQTVGKFIKISDNNLAEKYKRDLKKFTIPNDTELGDNLDLNGIGNYKNQFGRSKHSEKENSNNYLRKYGDFENSSDYPFGIFHNNTELNSDKDFEEPYPKSSINMDDETLINKFNDNKGIFKSKDNTLRSKSNYFGSKLINSVNNKEFYPEKFNEFNKNSINTKGVKISLLENETFIKLNDINSINSNTSIGRIGTLYNDGRPDDNGNYSLSFDLLTDERYSKFKIGDFILGLESNCIAVIVPESWDYDGIPHKSVFNKGLGTYLLEKYKNFPIFNKILQSDDKYRFSKKFNQWDPEIINNGGNNIYIKLDISPSNTNLKGIETKKLVISKPNKYKFLFDEDTSPIDRLNIPLNQEFSYSQNNLIEYDKVNINKSYLSGLYNNIQSNYLILETLESFNIKKNDKIYIKNHKLFNKYRNNKKDKILNIKNIEPFRNYLEYIKYKYELLDEDTFKYENNGLVYFKNVNHIYDYDLQKYIYHLGNGNDLTSAYHIDNNDFLVYNKFNSNNNSFEFGLRDRIINWFFDNKYVWNNNNIEKILKFESKYAKFKTNNKEIIIKLIVSPLDSNGKNFNTEFAYKNTNDGNEIIGSDYVAEAPYTKTYSNGTINTIKRNSENILPFLKGMGAYYYGTPSSSDNNLDPKLIGYVLDTTINSIDDYINNYNVTEYTDNYAIVGVKITNSGNNYNDLIPPIINFPHPDGIEEEDDPNFKKAKATAIVKNGKLTEIVLISRGFGYTSNIINIEIVCEDNNVDCASAIAYTSISAPTYSMYLLVNEDSAIFEEETGVINDNILNEIVRGTDIFYNFNKVIYDTFYIIGKNITEGQPVSYTYLLSNTSLSAIDDYYLDWIIEIVDGPGKGLKAIITHYNASNNQISITPDNMGNFIDLSSQYKLYIDNNNNNTLQKKDFKNYGNYKWNQRRAAATIYQGTLKDVANNDKPHLVSGHLEYFYKDFLQNKCIMHYNQMFSKEELEFFHNHQISLENKKYIIDPDVNVNNSNYTEDINSKYISYSNREKIFNPEIISYHSFDIGEKVYIFDHEKSVSKYHEMTINNPELVSELIETRKSSKYNKIYETENSGIENSCINVICNLWNGIESNRQFLNLYKPGKCVLLDIDFTKKIENGFMNKGYARVSGYEVPICGTNADYYTKTIEYDTLLENEARIKHTDNENVNRRSSQTLYLYNSKDCSNNINDMFQKNDIIFIGTSIIGNDELYPSELSNKSYDNIQELNVISDVTLASSHLEVKLKSPLLNDHIENELVISRYKYGEVFTENNNFFYSNSISSDSITINNNFITGDYVIYNNKGNESITINGILAKNNSKYFVFVTNDSNIIKLATSLNNLNNNIFAQILGNTNSNIHQFIKSRYTKVNFISENINININISQIEILSHGFKNGDLVIFKNENINLSNFNNLYNEHRYFIFKVDDDNIKLCNNWDNFNNNIFIEFIHTTNDSYTYSLTLFYENQVKIYKYLNDINYSNEIYIGTIIYFDWANKRYTKYNDENIKPINTISDTDYNSLDVNDKSLYKYKFTQQMNRIINIDSTNNDYILLTLDKTPLIYYPNQTPFIILKKNNIKNANVASSNCEFIDSFSDDLKYRNSIKNTNLSTQPFTINNKWYTKIFYQGHNSLNVNTKDINFNNNYKNNWKQGTKIFNNMTSKKIYIYGMKGIEIPFMPIPSTQVNKILTDHIENSNNITNIDSNYANNININTPYLNIEIIKPLSDNNYIIKPIIKEDYLMYNEKDINNLSIPGIFKYNYEYFDEYNDNDNDSIENIIDKYENYTNKCYWNDTDIYKDEESINYNYVVVEGIHLGYGGFIKETTQEDDNIINSVDGFTVLETYKNSDNNGFNIVIDIEEREMNLNLKTNNVLKKLFNNSTSSNNTIPAGIIDKKTQFNLLNTNIFKKTINIGKQGIICKKKINAPLNLEGESYIYLCIPKLAHFLNISKPIINSVFAKILLPGETNKPIFNSHIGGTVIFYNGELSELSELEIAFVTNEKNLFDFNGLNHSFTLEIFELINK